MRTHIARDGGVVVDQISDLQDNRRGVETDVGLRAASRLRVDVQQRGALFRDAGGHGVVEPQLR